MNFVTQFITKKAMRNVTNLKKMVNSSHFLNFVTYHFVMNYFVDFKSIYLISSHHHTPLQSSGKMHKNLCKKKRYIGDELICDELNSTCLDERVEKVIKQARQSMALMLTERAIDHCTESPRLSSREMAGLSTFATSLMSLENANN
jgi:hypothetical protein